jgi:hypothetical protein
MGTSILGPLPLITSNSMPSAGSGVRMSLNMITPSVWNARQGCSDSSIAISAVSDRFLKGMTSEYLQEIRWTRPHNSATDGQAQPPPPAPRQQCTYVAHMHSLPEVSHIAACLPHQPHRCPLRSCRAGQGAVGRVSVLWC